MSGGGRSAGAKLCGDGTGNERGILGFGKQSQSFGFDYCLRGNGGGDGLLTEMTNGAVGGGVAPVILPGFASLANFAAIEKKREKRGSSGKFSYQVHDFMATLARPCRTERTHGKPVQR